MIYSKTLKGNKIEIKGSYVPKGYTCKCLECKFTIELPKDTTDEKVNEIVKLITR